MAGNSAQSGRSVTSKITSILMAFTQGSEHSLTEIACLAGLPVSTAHRLISELTTRRLLERTDDGLYRAGLPLRMIGGSESCAPDLQERAPYVLGDLAAATRRRARLGVLRELEVAYIEKVPGSSPVTAFSPAATLPAHPTALGRAARVQPDERRRPGNRARPPPLHPVHGDFVRSLPAGTGRHPVDPGGRHPT